MNIAFVEAEHQPESAAVLIGMVRRQEYGEGLLVDDVPTEWSDELTAADIRWQFNVMHLAYIVVDYAKRKAYREAQRQVAAE